MQNYKNINYIFLYDNILSIIMTTIDSNEMSVTLKQGLQFKQKQNKLKKTKPTYVKAVSESILGKSITEGFSQSNDSPVTQTKQVLAKTHMTTTQKQEIQQLQNTIPLR